MKTRGTGRRPVKMKTEVGVMRPQAKDCQQTQQLE